jgi:hypothetical protein
MTGEQCREARGRLDWTRLELAKLALFGIHRLLLVQRRSRKVQFALTGQSERLARCPKLAASYQRAEGRRKRDNDVFPRSRARGLDSPR